MNRLQRIELKRQREQMWGMFATAVVCFIIFGIVTLVAAHALDRSMNAHNVNCNNPRFCGTYN